MNRVVIGLIAVCVVVAATLAPSPARADDEPALPDGGSIVTGTATALGDLGERAGPWSMTIRCEGDQQTRYKLCADSAGCAATAVNQLLDADRTFDIPVNTRSGLPPKRYLALRTEDAGVAFCKVQRQ